MGSTPTPTREKEGRPVSRAVSPTCLVRPPQWPGPSLIFGPPVGLMPSLPLGILLDLLRPPAPGPIPSLRAGLGVAGPGPERRCLSPAYSPATSRGAVPASPPGLPADSLRPPLMSFLPIPRLLRPVRSASLSGDGSLPAMPRTRVRRFLNLPSGPPSDSLRPPLSGSSRSLLLLRPVRLVSSQGTGICSPYPGSEHAASMRSHVPSRPLLLGFLSGPSSLHLSTLRPSTSAPHSSLCGAP